MIKTPPFLALAAIILWSTLATLVVSLAAVPPFLLLGAALILGGLGGVFKWRTWKLPLKTFIVGVTGIFGYHACLFLAFRYAPVVEANLLNYLWPLLIVVLSPLFLKKYTLKGKHILAALLGFSGALLIVSGGRLQFDMEHMPGYLLAGSAALIWACYSLLTVRLASFSSAAVGLFCLVSGLLSLIMHLLLEDPYLPRWIDLPFLLLLGLGPLGLSFYLWDAALKKGDPRIIGSLAYITPMLSTLFLVLAGVGRFTMVSFIAMILIICGAVIGSLKK